MIELEQEEILEETDPYDEASEEFEGTSDEFSGLTRENYVDRVRFSRA
jgi:hypothetical protein